MQVFDRGKGGGPSANDHARLAHKRGEITAIARLRAHAISQHRYLLCPKYLSQRGLYSIDALLVRGDEENSSSAKRHFGSEGSQRMCPVIARGDLPSGTGELAGQNRIDKSLAMLIGRPT